MKLINTVAAATDSDPLDLPPLYNTIDPNAVDSYVKHNTDGHISFVYADMTVTVEATGEIHLDECSSTLFGETTERTAKAQD